MELSPALYKCILKFQQDEATGGALYREIAKITKNEENKRIFTDIADAEQTHYETWRKYTGKDISADTGKIFRYKLLYRLLGETFVIRLFEKDEELGAADLERVEEELPEAKAIMAQEEEHENRLIEMIDEERLHYIGSMMLGLNDALVELTGTIAGMTFALSGTKMAALAAIITGIAATLSMAASNYLAERAERNPMAVKSSMYTGAAYLITVVILILPYLLLPNSMYTTAFIAMLVIVIAIIYVFNFFISVVQNTPFWSRFAEMAAISLGVTAISFGIGLIARMFIGADV